MPSALSSAPARLTARHSRAPVRAKRRPAPSALPPAAAQVFEQGALYDPKVLDIKEDDLMDAVTIAITRIAAASLELSYPTLASIPHSVVNGYKNVLAVSVATDYDFPLAEKVRARVVVARLFWRGVRRSW